MRLDKYLALSGLGSREEIRKMIRSGRVSVEGEKKPAPDTKVREDATVLLDGKPVLYMAFQYFLLHKPAGFLTARTDGNVSVVMDLFNTDENRKRLGGLTVRPDVAPVGRLDKDTEGLLLLTNDGALAHRLLSPKNEVPKSYYLRTDTPIPMEAPEILLKPVAFSDFTSKPARLEILGEREARITVTEGKFHEVKRLMHHAGADVVYLRRESFGPLMLGDLERGQIRLMTEEERASLSAI
ncbi:MAG: rRNA pseudouridine synthase [Lachnospiraceae bacterium]|nr:rRNA pseudouridine synthase [Lachnospiraceae bacterium]